MKTIIRFFLISLLAFTAGCAPRSIESYHTGENEEEIVRLLNERAYGKAIWLIESKNGRLPADKKIAFLLGQAYLGYAGFEPLAMASRVSGEQSSAVPDAQELFPDCPRAAISPDHKPETLCLLKRVYLQVPDADLVDMVRARELFRHAYPVAKDTPEWVNVLIGVVETASCVKRAGKVYIFAKHFGAHAPSDAELRWLIFQAKNSVHEASQALTRAEHSGKEITRLLTGNKKTAWFEQVKHTIQWADQTGLKELFDLLRENVLSPDDEARLGPTLDRIRALLDEQEARIRGT